MPSRPIHACRACGGSLSARLLDLGALPLVNALPASVDAPPDPRYPLALVRCADCTLIQIDHTVPPEEMFSDYPYFSSNSDTMVRSAADLVDRACDRAPDLRLAAEIASNDGYLLQRYVARGVPVVGVEPAANVAAAARARGVRTEIRFFGADAAGELRDQYGPADVIHANNVLAHVPDLPGFVQGIARWLREGGTAWIEVPWAARMLEELSYDTIYHEHLSYFTLTALSRLAAGAGLSVDAAEVIPLHGGSLRVCLRKGAGAGEGSAAILAAEAAAITAAGWESFSERVRALQSGLRAMLAEEIAAGRRLAAYGAAAKGVILLETCGVGPELRYVVDRSPHKQGRFMPGSRLPILPPSRLLEDGPDTVLVLTWNFFEEIARQQQSWRGGAPGRRFLVPIPALRRV